MCALAVSDPKSFSIKVAAAMLKANIINIAAVSLDEKSIPVMVFKTIKLMAANLKTIMSFLC